LGCKREGVVGCTGLVVRPGHPPGPQGSQRVYTTLVVAALALWVIERLYAQPCIARAEELRRAAWGN